MISFTTFDYAVLGAFFAIVLAIGLFAKYVKRAEGEDYLLGSRKLNLPMFVATTVATWYGGILGVGEFTYKYGILSWITQGLPYYVFALLFAFLFAGKIRETELFTLPDKMEKTYGKNAALLSAVIIFFLVNPAPYLLMTGALFSLLFNVSFAVGMFFAVAIVSAYLLRGGFKATVYTDIFQFIVMFAGFILIAVTLFSNYGGADYLVRNLPPQLLSLENANPFYVAVWFLIALWTFVDPGFHQRSYAARNAKVAKYGIIVSVLFWMIFDFLTVSTGLFSRAVLGENINAVISYPLLADKVLSSGAKGLFFAALFATILSTLNSMTFIAATTYSRDFIYRFAKNKKSVNIERQTQIGIFIASALGFVIALTLQSVIEIWYLLGSILIPGLIFPVIGAYYPKWRIDKRITVIEIVAGFSASALWFALIKLSDYETEIEPMIVGLIFAFVIHLYGMRNK